MKQSSPPLRIAVQFKVIIEVRKRRGIGHRLVEIAELGRVTFLRLSSLLRVEFDWQSLYPASSCAIILGYFTPPPIAFAIAASCCRAFSTA